MGIAGARVVEAAGVEPASEKARRDKPTCVAGSYSRRRPGNRQAWRHPAWLLSA